MNVLLIGSGGREHALAWKMSQSPLLSNLYIAPGNGGTDSTGKNVDLDTSNFASILDFCHQEEIDMIVCGPEKPLVDGFADYFSSENINVVGPSQEGAMLEGSKSFAKEFMADHDIPTAKYGAFTADDFNKAMRFIDEMSAPVVLKADGLAAGKGVLILDSKEEAKKELQAMFDGKFGEAGETVVIEQFLSGIEFSVFVLTDGQEYLLLPVAKDYKRIGEGDTGLNTGGMGTVSPPPFVDQALMDKVEQRIIEPTIRGIVERKIDYKGFIFFGLIDVDGDPYVIEYNCRLGDPEAQVILPRLQSDLLGSFSSLFDGTLADRDMLSTDQTSLAVVLASGGYPERYEKGIAINLKRDIDEGEIIFHAGTRQEEGQLVTSGGRVMACVALAPDLESARSKAYNLVEFVEFEDMYFRKDIGLDMIPYV
ncbi:MAG: phosphoribosylamine--glycine ligase [Saprospiraceae bacterium]|nr:phosphoribosylamine--glycine ligase [Saprospiraceae bacterium]